MRDLKQMVNSFVPGHEKTYEAQMFVDTAIKSSVEYSLECCARALSGGYAILLEKSDVGGYTWTEHIKTDSDGWVEVTKKYQYMAKMEEYSFFADSTAEIWLNIIEFWMKPKVYPCGGSGFPKLNPTGAVRDQK